MDNGEDMMTAALKAIVLLGLGAVIVCAAFVWGIVKLVGHLVR